MKTITLFVEGAIDKIIINHVLKAAQYPCERVVIEVAGNKANAINFAVNAAKKWDNSEMIIATFVDADTVYIEEAILETKKRLGDAPVEVFFAVPEIEAWVFADDILLEKKVKESAKREMKRMPLPEELFYPKMILKNWLKAEKTTKQGEEYDFLSEINIERAAARCPSLAYFLKRFGELLDIDTLFLLNSIDNVLANQPPKRVFARLLGEVATPNQVFFRTMSGYDITADNLRTSVLEDTAVGKEYVGTVLRVARDLIRIQAKKAKNAEK